MGGVSAVVWPCNFLSRPDSRFSRWLRDALSHKSIKDPRWKEVWLGIRLMRSVVSQRYVGAEKRLRNYLQLRVCMKIALAPFRLTPELSRWQPA
jgi:hypothetical protein